MWCTILDPTNGPARLSVLHPAAVVSDHNPHGVRVDLDVERDPVARAGAVTNTVRQQLCHQEAQLCELIVLDGALEPVERVAALTGGLRTDSHPHVQPADDLVAAQVDSAPPRSVAIAVAPMKARKR